MLVNYKLATMWLYSPSFQTTHATRADKIVPTAAPSRDSTVLVRLPLCNLPSKPCAEQCGCLGADGGLADFLVVAAGNARKLPPHIPLDVAGMFTLRRCVVIV